MSKASRRRAGVKSLTKARATVPVAKEKAIVSSGPKKGRPRKGCRLVKGGKAKCTASVAASLGVKRSKKRSKRKRAA
jgi:hypothetical protein